MLLLGHDDSKAQFGRADREDGEGVGEDARRVDRVGAVHGAEGDEHQHRVSAAATYQDTLMGGGANARRRYEQLTVRANALREDLHTEIDKILHDTIKFKIHIQTNLSEYENFVADELEKELCSDEMGENTRALE